MLTLTCRATGQPIPLRSDRFSGAVPLPDAPGCRVRSIDGEVFIAAESTSEIAAMLQPAPEPAGASGPDAARTAADMLRQLAELIGSGHEFTAGDIGCVMDGHMGLSDAGWQDTAAGLERLAARLESR